MKKSNKEKPFWIKNSKPNSSPEFKIDPALLSEWLEQSNFFQIKTFGNPQIVKVTNNIVSIKTPMEVYADVLDFVKLEDDRILQSCFIQQGEQLLISKKAILGSLPMFNIPRYRDSKEIVRLFYKNIVIIISKNNLTSETYKKFEKLNEFIFEKQIINREINLSVKNKSEFKKFLKCVTYDKLHFENIMCSIGYLISSYKNPSQTKAVIFTDVLSQIKNEAYGRSGKGIIIKAISEIIPVVEYNGKITDLTNDKFAFQNVNLTTQLIVLQDVDKSFKFESLFSILTDNMSIERKHCPKIDIPFSESPKIAITTNYTIPQNSYSYKDRKLLVLLNNFFNSSNKPEEHLKGLLFNSWSSKEFKKFDNFIISCVQLFLKDGLSVYEVKQLSKEKLIKSTSIEFLNLMDIEILPKNIPFKAKDICAKIDVPGLNAMSKGKMLSRWIYLYAEYKGFLIEKKLINGVTAFYLKPNE